MDTTSRGWLRLMACVCLGMALVTGCAGTGVARTPTGKCDPTGNAEARQGCNR